MQQTKGSLVQTCNSTPPLQLAEMLRSVYADLSPMTRRPVQSVAPNKSTQETADFFSQSRQDRQLAQLEIA